MITNRQVLLFTIIINLITSSCCKSVFENEQLIVSPHISICVLGNSYSNDSFCYVPFILKKYGITCSIHIYSRPNGSLQNLYTEWSDANKSVTHYYTDTRIDKKWRKTTGMSAKDILTIERWDIVSIQQYSKQVKKESLYTPYLDNILDSIATICTYPTKIAWFMAYNRANDNNAIDNLKAQKVVVEEHDFNIVFPVATTLFNCQTNDGLAQIGDSEYGKLYSADNIHLQDGLPRYAASLTIIEALLREYAPDYSVLGDNTRPYQRWIMEIGGISPRGESVGINEYNCYLVQQAAIKANNNPFEISPF